MKESGGKRREEKRREEKRREEIQRVRETERDSERERECVCGIHSER